MLAARLEEAKQSAERDVAGRPWMNACDEEED
jgi:hypothetical protein